jgi:exopolysaccharide biosynthesis WecB/TagA/CpsF family protein
MQYQTFLDKISKHPPDLENLFIESTNKLITVTFSNPLSFKILRENNDYLKYLEQIDYVFSDGMLLCSFIEKVRKEKIARVSFDGNSIATKVFELCKFYNKRVALVGTEEKNINTAVKKLQDKLNIVYHRNGFFKDDAQISQFFDELEANNIEVIIFGMGIPRQEKMLYLLKERKINGLAFTCGRYLEQVAKRGILYYPDFYNRYNLRWIYRIFDEPGKMLKRYIIDYSYFYMAYIKFLIKFIL